MLKIRLQGTTNDIKWFIKMLKKDERFKMNTPSEIMDISSSAKYKRIYTEIFRLDEPMTKYAKEKHKKDIKNRYFGTGTVFGYKKKK